MKKVFLLIALISSAVFAEIKEYPYESMTNEEHKKLITTGLEKVRMFFKDPDAVVRFKKVVGTSDKHHDYPTHICGYVTDNLIHDGDVKIQRFIATTKGRELLIDSPESGFSFELRWNSFCK